MSSDAAANWILGTDINFCPFAQDTDFWKVHWEAKQIFACSFDKSYQIRSVFLAVFPVENKMVWQEPVAQTISTLFGQTSHLTTWLVQSRFHKPILKISFLLQRQKDQP